MPEQVPIRVLVVDDTATYRAIVTDVVKSIPGAEFIGVAANGKLALDRLDSLQPDLITLDLEMPELDGLAFLELLSGRPRPPGVIVVSAHTDSGATMTIKALRLGAFDFVLKPCGTDPAANKAQLRAELAAKLDAFARSRMRVKAPPTPTAPSRSAPVAKPSDVARRMSRVAGKTPPEVIAIGISTGGPQALSVAIPKIPGDLGVPILIVQHMPPKFTASLASSLNDKSPLQVREACDGESVRPGAVLIAPGGRQMKIEQTGSGVVIRITDDPPENSCRPAVDYLFRSVAHVFGERSLGVIMTGMGSDGLLGCRLLRRRGARILAQDAASCVVYGMPRAIVDDGLADAVVPLDRIAEEITRSVKEMEPACR